MFAQPGGVVLQTIIIWDSKPAQVKAEVLKELVCFTAHVMTLVNNLRIPAVQFDHQNAHQFQISVYWILQNLTVLFDCETICRSWEQISQGSPKRILLQDILRDNVLGVTSPFCQ